MRNDEPRPSEKGQGIWKTLPDSLEKSPLKNEIRFVSFLILFLSPWPTEILYLQWVCWTISKTKEKRISFFPSRPPSFRARTNVWSDWVLPCFTVFYRVLLTFNRFYWVLLGFTRFFWILLGFTRFHWVLPGLTGFYIEFYTFRALANVFYWVLPGFTGFYWVLLGFTGFYWVLLGFTLGLTLSEL